MSEQATAVIEAVTSKEGATNGKPWRKYSVKTEDGTYYSTFSKEVAEQAHNIVGQLAEIMWKASGNEGQFRDIIAARPVNGSAAVTADHGADVSAIPSAHVNGTADWDVIGLRKTRCLLWAEYLSSPLAASVEAGASGVAQNVYILGAAIIEKAERDIYWRSPATEDVDVQF